VTVYVVSDLEDNTYEIEAASSEEAATQMAATWGDTLRVRHSITSLSGDYFDVVDAQGDYFDTFLVSEAQP